MKQTKIIPLDKREMEIFLDFLISENEIDKSIKMLYSIDSLSDFIELLDMFYDGILYIQYETDDDFAKKIYTTFYKIKYG